MNARIRQAVLARDDHRCVYCGRRPPEVTLEADHIYPRARGGSGVDTNLAASCGPCNLAKSDRVLDAPPSPEPLGLQHRQLGGPITDRGIPLGRLSTCEDRCPICATMTRPRFLADGDARQVQLSYRCDTGHPWQAWFRRDLAIVHSDAVRWDAAMVPA